MFHSTSIEIIYNTIYDLSVWLRTGYHPAEINLFRSFTGYQVLNNFITVSNLIKYNDFHFCLQTVKLDTEILQF